jgi:hypothetical protein
MNKAKRGAQALEPFTYYPIAFLAPLAGRDDLPDLIVRAINSFETVARRLEDDGPAGCVCCDRDITALRDIAGIITVEVGEDRLSGPVCAVCAADPTSILPKAAATFRHIMRAARHTIFARSKGPLQ